MNVWGTPGRTLFAIAIACFGIHYLAFANGSSVAPGPPWFPEQTYLSWGGGVGLLAVALSLLLEWKPRWAALILGVALLVRVAIVHAPRVFANVHDPGPWTSAAEILSLAGGAFTISVAKNIFFSKTTTRLAQCMFATPLLVFGAQHLMYGTFISSLIPVWIPARLFWTYAVGIAFILSALAIIFRRFALSGSASLGLMFLLWVVIVHMPRVAAASHNGDEWTSAFMALAMAGSAWSVAGTFASKH